MRHPSDHFIITKDGRKIKTTRTHHQMQYPFNLPFIDYEIIAEATNIKSSIFHIDEESITNSDVANAEIVFYKNTNSLAIQGHPELDWATEEFRVFCLETLKTKFTNYKNDNNNININNYTEGYFDHMELLLRPFRKI